MTDERSGSEVAAELEDLRARLAVAEEALHAIRNGEVDAVVVTGRRGEQVYTLGGADQIYRQLIETMSEGALTLSADGVISYCNVRLAEMLGRPLDQVMGTALRSYLTPADQRELDAILVQVCTAPNRRELNLKSSDGRLVPVYLSASHLRREGAEPVICLVLTDLTEQKIHEQLVAAKGELQSAKAFLDGVINAIADPVFVKDDKRRFVVVNDALCAIVGRPREALLGEDGDDMFPEEQVAVFRKTDAGVLETGEDNLNEESLSDLSTGEVRTIVTRKSRYVDPTGGRFLAGVIRDITEHKRAEAALRESEMRYRTLFEDAQDGMALAEAKTGLIVDCNRALCRMVERDRAELVGKPQSIFHPAKTDGEEVIQTFRQHREGEPGQTLEDLLLCKSDKLVPVEIRAASIRMNDRDYLLGIFRDVTEGRRVKEALRRNSEMQTATNTLLGLSIQARTITAFLEHALDLIVSLEWLSFESRGAVFLADENTKTLHLEVHQGFSKELLARCSSIPYGCCLCGRAAATRTVQSADRLDERHDILYGGITPHGHYCVPILSGDHVLGVINLYVKEGHTRSSWEQDFLKAVANTLAGVIERKLSESAVLESEKRYRELFDNIGSGVAIYDVKNDGEDFVYKDLNKAAERIDGDPKEYLLGKSIRTARPGIEDFGLLEVFRRVWKTGEPESFPAKHYTDDRLDRWYDNFIYRLPPGELVAVYDDVTERERAKAQRETLEEQLRASQKMEAIGSLAGGVAHDFNNLLSVILSYTGFAMEGVRDGDPLMSDLLEVKQAGESAAALTRQLLAFSRKQVLQPVALSLNQSATSVEKMLRRILGEDIDLVQTLAPDLGLTLADPGQIEQVLMNLVVNARDAMLEGGKLTIETSNVEIDEEYAARHVAVKPGSYVQLAVSDTGCGMDEETRARIFEPFFTTKEKGKGTGLGLSTAYGIVKQSGGNIWIYSELGQGTTFKVYLPRELSVTTAVVIKPSTVPNRATGTETILVVEDEEALLKVALRTLGAAGYEVLTASDGDDALLKSTQHPGDIHLLLTDVVMPRMSGRVLAQNLLRARPAIKVLYMSGYTDNAIVHHGVLDAGTQFLAKPFTAADLARKVREVLDGGITSLADWHEQVAKDVAEVKEEQPLDEDALRAVPRDVQRTLRRAVTAARYDEIAELIETLRKTEPDLAAGLRRMADLFDYDGLRNLLGQWKEE